MKKTLALVTIGTLLFPAAALRAAESTNALTGPFPNELDNQSYAVGVSIATSMKRNLVDLNQDLVFEAMHDALGGKPLKLTEEQMSASLNTYRRDVIKLRNEQRAKESEEDLAASTKWLAENKKKPGVQVKEVSLPGGKTAELQYKILKEGDGPTPTAKDKVTVNYRGTLIDGKEFDSSAKRGKPAEFGVTQVIRGWTEALEMMKQGAKWELYIPPELAYGAQGRPGIPPNSALIFDVELLSINTPKPPPTPTTSRPIATSDIIKVPSAEGLKRGEKIQVIKAAEAERMAREAQEKAAETNGTANTSTNH